MCLFCVASFSYILSPITVCISFNMFICCHIFRLWFLSFNAIHSHVYTLMLKNKSCISNVRAFVLGFHFDDMMEHA